MAMPRMVALHVDILDDSSGCGALCHASQSAQALSEVQLQTRPRLGSLTCLVQRASANIWIGAQIKLHKWRFLDYDFEGDWRWQFNFVIKSQKFSRTIKNTVKTEARQMDLLPTFTCNYSTYFILHEFLWYIHKCIPK